MLKKILAAVLAAAAVSATAVVGFAEVKTITPGVLTVVTSADYPPFEFHKMIDGNDQIVGYDMSIAKYIADSLGLELEIKDVNFDSCLLELSTDKADVCLAGLQATEERMMAYDFSDTYYHVGQCLVVRKGDAEKYKSAADFNGKSVSAQSGSLQITVGETCIPESPITQLAKIPDLLLDLAAGKCDGAIIETLVAKTFIANNDAFEVAFEFDFETAGNSAAVKQGNTEMLNAINAALAELKGNDKATDEAFLNEAAALAADEM